MINSEEIRDQIVDIVQELSTIDELYLPPSGKSERIRNISSRITETGKDINSDPIGSTLINMGAHYIDENVATIAILMTLEIPKESTRDSLLKIAKFHRSCRVSQAAMIVLEHNKYWEMTPAIQKFRQLRINARHYGSEQHYADSQIIGLLEAIRAKWSEDHDGHFAGRSIRWQWESAWPLLAFMHQTGEVTLKDLLCIQPNEQKLNDDLNFLVNKKVIKRKT